MGTVLDVELVRRDFPILEEPVHGRRLVWLDNAATTQKPQAVIERLRHFYEHENSNIHRAAHELAARASDAYEDARRAPSVLDRPPSWDQALAGATVDPFKTWGRLISS